MTRLLHTLAGKTRAWDPFDQAAFVVEHARASTGELLVLFAKLRRNSVATLTSMNLTAAEPERRGQHPELSQVTLKQLLATWVVHDLDHLAQIVRTMAKVYMDTVGPWQVYLSILRHREPSLEPTNDKLDTPVSSHRHCQ